MPRKRINREDWILAGIDVLDKRGRLEKPELNEACLDLGVTKGSFYTHFRSFAEWQAQVMERAAARAEPASAAADPPPTAPT